MSDHTLIPATKQQLSTVQHDKSRRAPYIMLIGLALGFAISLAHHLMNQNLDGQVVADVAANHLSQSWILSINTLLAFMVKTSFTAAIGIAFVQRQWSNLHRDIFTIGELNNITSALEDCSRLTTKNIWKKVPLLATVALVSWMLPFAIIYPPGALTTETPTAQSTLHLLQVPQLNLSMSGNSWIMPNGEDEVVYSDNRSYFGQWEPHSAVRRIMHATASGGQTLSLVPKYANQSYHLDFDAPNLVCTPATEDVIYNATILYGRWLPASPDMTQFVNFSAWAMSAVGFFDAANYERSDNGWKYIGVLNPFADLFSEDASRIFFMSNGGQWSGSKEIPTITWVDHSDTREAFTRTNMRVNVTECKLYNASYNVDFEFKDSRQTTITSISNTNPVSLANATRSMPYYSMIASFGLFLVGEMGASYGHTYMSSRSNIDLVDGVDLGSAENVSTTMVNLFQNFTLSLLTEPLLSNEAWGMPISVNVTSWPIKYVYTPKTLLIAYSAAFFASLICCLIGMQAFMINENNSYQNIFSTYLRATRISELYSPIDDEDIGTDPLPKSLGQAKVSIVACKQAPMIRMTRRSQKFWWNKFGI